MHGISFGGLIKSTLSDNDWVRGKIEDEVKKKIGGAMTDVTLPVTTVNPKGETQAVKIMPKQKRLRFDRH